MITIEEYALRRHKVMAAMDEGSIAVIAAAPLVLRNGDAHYPYRQNSDFYYLTGFPESEAIAVLINHGKLQQFILFNQPYDETKTLWIGEPIGQQKACEEYGADNAYPIQAFERAFLALLKKSKQVYTLINHHESINQRLTKILKKSFIRRKILALDPIVHEQRLIKSVAEVDLMRQGVEVTAEAHRSVMSQCGLSQWEYQLEGQLIHYFHDHGCRHLAYESIVASGKNACVLHYVENRSRLSAGQLVLIDAGVEYQSYATDVTRTFPIDGRFSAEQKVIYEIVLQAQLAGIAVIKPGVSWNTIQQTVAEVITDGLLAIGLLKGDKIALLEQHAYQAFFPHGVGHWLGLDVHDVGEYKIQGEWRSLAENMVLTVEPGIYIPEDREDIPAYWRGLGIRIEDDVVVTAQGCEVLSASVPKSIHDIETLMTS